MVRVFRSLYIKSIIKVKCFQYFVCYKEFNTSFFEWLVMYFISFQVIKQFKISRVILRLIENQCQILKLKREMVKEKVDRFENLFFIIRL